MPTPRLDIKRTFGAVAAVAVLGVFAGCGGGGDDPEPAPVAATGDTGPVAITTDELIRQGDQICAETNLAVGTIDASTADEATKSSQRTNIYDGLATKLNDLGTPSDGQPPTDVIAAVQDLADGSTDTTALQDAASAYGFTECAEAPSAPSTSGTSTGTEGSDSTGSGSTYTPPATTTPPPATTPAPAPPTTPAPAPGGGVAPPSGGTGGSSGGGTSGGSSGGIGPG